MASVRASVAHVAAVLCAAALMVAAHVASAQAWETGTDGLLPIPALASRVTDLTQSLSKAEAAALEAKLADWEARTSNQLAVLIVPTTQPEPIESYSLRVAEKWKIGRKGQDNGALFLVAKNDRKMRIEVGYGLEGVLTDVTARRIIAENVAPSFREGKYAAGIDAGVDRIIAVVGSGAPLAAPSTTSTRAKGLSFSPDAIFPLIIGVIVVGGILRKIAGRMVASTVGAVAGGIGAWLFTSSIVVAIFGAIVGFLFLLLDFAQSAGRGGGWSSGGGGWSGGGGGGSSSGGGFSGGGGSFGGGGASGNW
ncbi:MAG: TPM domain-containing protein [Betaproteobacteria bacterium]